LPVLHPCPTRRSSDLRYGFEVVGAVIPGGDTHARPSAGELAALVAEIERHDLPAIFAENITGTDLVETLAREIGREVEVVTLYRSEEHTSELQSRENL